MSTYCPRLVINFNNCHLISVCSEIEVVVDNPIFTKNLQKMKTNKVMRIIYNMKSGRQNLLHGQDPVSHDDSFDAIFDQ